METIIRQATDDDIEKLIKARFDYFEAEEWALTHEQRSEFEITLRKYFSANINKNFFAVFVESGGEIISVAFLSISEKPANLSFPTGKFGVIQNVLTYPKYRNMGFATRALNVLVEEAKRRGVSQIELMASAQGKPLYEKLGFSEAKSEKFMAMRMNLL
ncbi:MAG: GNAT family N-acetyltransferase [Clostridiales bacterium]|jgi:N-acetylglutamate synthase-like GNAT family acetyltransferase|nr:GNAT family N-acetyltransferase [Clostridiales bacterium]